jgi:hypothetical protein
MGIRLGALFSCYLVAYAPLVSVKLVALCFAMLFGYIMFLRDFGIITNPILTWWKLRGKVSWQPSPDFLVDLSHKMKVKLNKKCPFGVTDSPIGAAANMSQSQVIVSRYVLALPEAERNAVVAHEVAHLRPNQFIKLLLLCYFVMLGAATMGNVHPIITTIGVTALFLILRPFVSWNLEYDADHIGSDFSSKEALISALKHLVKPEKYDESSDTHPSVNNRISKLLAPQEPLWVRLSLLLMRIITAKSFREEFLDSFIQDLKEQCQRTPKFFRPMVVTVELLRAILIWGYHWN